MAYLKLSGESESNFPLAFSPFGEIEKDSVALVARPGSVMWFAVFRAIQLPSPLPKRPAFTGAASGCLKPLIHSLLSCRMTFSTSGGFFATQPWLFKKTSARQSCPPFKLARLPPDSL